MYEGTHIIIGETSAIEINSGNEDMKNKEKNPKLTAWYFDKGLTLFGLATDLHDQGPKFYGLVLIKKADS